MANCKECLCNSYCKDRGNGKGCEIFEPKIKTCCICGCKFEGYGNNPAPVKQSGVCCDECNMEKVIPSRLEAFF